MEEILASRGVMPTPVRKLVYRCLENSEFPLSLSDLESMLDTVDKSTISRTLSTFKDHQILHSFTDGSGSVKYELCFSQGEKLHDDLHVHFRCKKCGHTNCLPEISIPIVKLPIGYIVNEVSYIITGICNECSRVTDVK